MRARNEGRTCSCFLQPYCTHAPEVIVDVRDDDDDDDDEVDDASCSFMPSSLEHGKCAKAALN